MRSVAIPALVLGVLSPVASPGSEPLQLQFKKTVLTHEDGAEDLHLEDVQLEDLKVVQELMGGGLGDEDPESLVMDWSSLRHSAPLSKEDMKLLSKRMKTQPLRAPSGSATSASLLFRETFQDTKRDGWSPLEGDEYTGLWTTEVDQPEWTVGEKVRSFASNDAYYGFSHKLLRPFDPRHTDHLFASMEVKFPHHHFCGGAYFKLHNARPHTRDTSDTHDTPASVPYSVLFGPDKCGPVVNEVHLLLRYQHPARPGEFVEEPLRGFGGPVGEPKFFAPTYQYGFALHRQNGGQYQVFRDGQAVGGGSIKEHAAKHLANQPHIPDPDDRKPADWVDEEFAPDLEARKPADWDETAPALIPDRNAVKPDDWDQDMPTTVPNPHASKPKDWVDAEDGPWRAPPMPNPDCLDRSGCGPWTPPLVKNPNFKGPWTAPLKRNAGYKGAWEPQTVPNPHHFDIEDVWSVLLPFDSISFEVWAAENGTTVDNILVTTDEAEFQAFLTDTFKYKRAIEDENLATIDRYRAEEKWRAPKSTSPYRLLDAVTHRAREWFTEFREARSASSVMIGLGLPLALLAYGVKRGVRMLITSQRVSPKAAGAEPPPSRKPQPKEARPDASVEPTTLADKENTGSRANRVTRRQKAQAGQ